MGNRKRIFDVLRTINAASCQCPAHGYRSNFHISNATPLKDYAFEIKCSTLRCGIGVTREVGQDLVNMNAKNVCVMTDSNVVKLPPLKTTLDSLTKNGVNYKVFDKVRVEPTDTSFKEAISFAKANDFDSFVAVGGGSVIDTLKAANLYSCDPDADFLDYVNAPVGKGKPVEVKVKPMIANNIGSLKKRVAPLPPAVGLSHAGLVTHPGHAQHPPPHPRSTPSPSADSTRSLHVASGVVKHRPQQPPPTPPPATLHNGAHHRDEPTPPPRKECSSQDSSLELCDMSDACLEEARGRERERRCDSRSLDVSDTSSVHSRSPSASITMMGGLRRCRALYDCSADNEDELSFREGEVIVVINERTEDDNWMEGQVEGTGRRGMFPVSFVHMLPD